MFRVMDIKRLFYQNDGIKLIQNLKEEDKILFYESEFDGYTVKKIDGKYNVNYIIKEHDEPSFTFTDFRDVYDHMRRGSRW